jgi:CubicO group peptidase (beta-lactamase class C family)
MLLATCAVMPRVGIGCSRAPSPGLPAVRAGIDIDAGSIQQLTRELRLDPKRDLKALLILQDGALISETYFNGASEDQLHDVRSVGKSITSALVGIALDQQLIRSVDDSVARYFSEPIPADKASIRLRDLLTMRSGLAADDDDPNSPGNEDRLNLSPDFVNFAFQLPMKSAPGTVFKYASVNAFLAGALLENAAGLRLDRFAVRHLFGPLRIEKYVWEADPRDRVTGQGNLSLRPRDIAQIGQLFLDAGLFHGKSLLSPGWIEESFREQVSVRGIIPFADSYGYLWYAKTYVIRGESVRVQLASGSGGNRIYLVPSRRMVLVITSSAYNKGYGHRRSESMLVSILEASQ